MKGRVGAFALACAMIISLTPAQLAAEPVLHKVDGHYVDTADNPLEVSEQINKHWKEDSYQEDGSDYQAQRIVVNETSNLPDSHGAEDAIYDATNSHYLLEYDSEKDTKQAYQQLVSEYGSENVSLDRLVHTSYNTVSWGTSVMGLDNLKSSAEYDSTIANNNVTVAVMDTGINTSHEMFSGRILGTSKSFVDGSIEDDEGHGTHVAGIICDGTPANVKLMVIRIMDSSGTGSVTNIISATQYAISQGADVVNMSLGIDDFDASTGGYLYTQWETQLKNAYNNGVVLLAASGNGDSYGNAQNMSAARSYPAQSDYTLAIGAIDGSKSWASFSNFGTKLDFVAPGVYINSAYTGGSSSYKEMSGTSMATPGMSAAAAMIKLYHPGYNAAYVKQVLKEQAIDLGVSGRDNYYGYGYVEIGTPAETLMTGKPDSGSSGSSSASSGSSKSTSVVKAVVRKIKAKKKGFKITWAPKSTVDGYQIRYARKKSMASAKKKTVSDATKSSKTVKKLKSKKNYYVQVRCFKYVNGVKKYGKWSAKVKVKTK